MSESVGPCLSRDWGFTLKEFAISRSLELLESRILFDGAASALVLSEVDTPPALYVSTEGADTNTGLSVQDAFRTIHAAVQQTAPGSIVYVLPGVYAETLDNIPGGQDWNSAVQIVAYDSSDRPVLRPPAGALRVLTFASAASSYIEVDGFILDAVNTSHDAVKITWSTAYGGSHHIRIENSEIMNAPRQGILTSGFQQGVSHVELVGLDIHDNGTTRFDHGIYISTPYTIVENSVVHNNSGWGIHNYGGDPSYNTYRNNRLIDNNSVQQDGIGIGIYNGHDIMVDGNVVSGNHIGIDVKYGAENVVVSHNLVSSNAQAGIVIGTDVSAVQLNANQVDDHPLNVWLLNIEEVEFSQVLASGESTMLPSRQTVIDDVSGARQLSVYAMAVSSGLTTFFVHCPATGNKPLVPLGEVAVGWETPRLAPRRTRDHQPAARGRTDAARAPELGSEVPSGLLLEADLEELIAEALVRLPDLCSRDARQ